MDFTERNEVINWALKNPMVKLRENNLSTGRSTRLLILLRERGDYSFFDNLGEVREFKEFGGEISFETGSFHYFGFPLHYEHWIHIELPNGELDPPREYRGLFRLHPDDYDSFVLATQGALRQGCRWTLIEKLVDDGSHEVAFELL